MSVFLVNAWSLFSGLWYWVPVGVILGEVVGAKLSPETIQKALHARGLRPIVTASVAGAAIPMCACGVIPFLVTFLSLGVPLAPVLAFTAASPIMDPTDFLLTVGALGWTFALVTLAAAMVLGLGTSTLYLWLSRLGLVETSARSRAKASSRSDGSPTTFKSWLTHGLAQLWFVGRYLLLAIVLGAALQTLVPPAVVGKLLGAHAWYTTGLGVVLGLATYGISSVPFAKVLLEMGAAPGAVMAFYLAGHATSVGLITTMATLVRRRTFVLYVTTTAVVSLIFGLAFQLLV